jgi:hypothetical protein
MYAKKPTTPNFLQRSPVHKLSHGSPAILSRRIPILKTHACNARSLFVAPAANSRRARMPTHREANVAVPSAVQIPKGSDVEFYAGVCSRPRVNPGIHTA